MDTKISNLECKLRFSTDVTMECLRTLYVDNLRTVSEQCPIMEASKPNNTKMKKELTKEASELADSEEPTIARLGRTAINFLTIGALVFTDAMEAITAVLIVGGVILVKCISFIEKLILYASTILYPSLFLGGLMLVENGLGSIYNSTKDKNTARYVTLSERLKERFADKATVTEASVPSNLRTKRSLQKDAAELATHKDPKIVNLGKMAGNFLKTEALWFTQLMEAIASVLLIGGVALSICIPFIIAIIIYAVTVLPISVILGGLKIVEATLGPNYSITENKDVRQYVVIAEEIKRNATGVKDVRTLDNLATITYQYYDAMLTDMKHGFNWYPKTAAGIIESAISNFNPHKANVLRYLSVYQDLAPVDNVVTLEATSPMLTYMEDTTNEQSYDLLKKCVSESMLSIDGLLHGTMCILADVCEQTTLVKFLNCYKNTVKYELLHEAYKDLPIIEASNIVLNYCRNCWEGHDVMMEQIDTMDQLFGQIISETYNEIREDTVVPSAISGGFSPDPFNVYDLTPFPVATRKIGNTLAKLEFAETDEEITEAMLELGRISTVINENYYVDAVDGQEVIVEAKGKKARDLSDKANKKFAKGAIRDKARTAKTATKRAINPMEKFINAQYQKIREADKAERRDIIMKGGSLPKVWRWVKRGIMLLIGSSVGTKIPVVAMITGITFIGFVASDKYLDRRERTKLLQEIEDEIEICNEKIDDSRGDDNKQKKYELMRIRNNLKRTQDKIRYGLRY